MVVWLKTENGTIGKSEDVYLRSAHIMQRLARDLQLLAWRRKDPLRSGAVNIATERFLRDQDADDAAS